MNRVRLETEQLKILVSGSGGKTLMSELWALAGSQWADQVSILEKSPPNDNNNNTFLTKLLYLFCFHFTKLYLLLKSFLCLNRR